MKNKQITIDPKDFIVALALALSPREGPWTYQAMAIVLGLSPSQVHGSVGRLVGSGLLNGRGLKAKVNRQALADFIVFGARYAYPPVLGQPARGLLTGASSEFFAPVLAGGEAFQLVWPCARGNARGVCLAPLHPCVPEASLRDPALHEALVNFDALRTGGAREREAAEAFFRRRLAWSS